MKLKNCKVHHIIALPVLSILLLLPFLSILTNVWYQTCNETSITTTEMTEINPMQMIQGEKYYISTNASVWYSQANRIYCLDENNNEYWIYNTANSNVLYKTSTGANPMQLPTNTNIEIIFNYWFTPTPQLIITRPTTINTFDLAIKNVEKISTFNFVKDTSTYTTITNAFSGLNINNSILPLLLTYWIIIIAIYLVFEIIIKSFTLILEIIESKRDF